MEEKKENTAKDFIGCGFSSLLGLCIYGGIGLLLFWLCAQIFGWKM